MHHRLHFSFKLHKLSHQIFLLGGQRNSSFPLKGFYFEKNHKKIWGHNGMLVEKGNQNGEECTWKWSLLETCFRNCHMRCKDIIFWCAFENKIMPFWASIQESLNFIPNRLLHGRRWYIWILVVSFLFFLESYQISKSTICLHSSHEK